MALRARLSPPRDERNDWPWHEVKWTSIPVSLLSLRERRLEADNYLASGYATRVAIEASGAKFLRMQDVARVWQPARLKGIVVDAECGTPFLAATQVFDQRPIPRKFLALARTESAYSRFVSPGAILVTCSGSVGRATLARTTLDGVLISHDLLRIEPKLPKHWGWIYAYLRSTQVRAMMSAAQYGHIIKHLETSHINSLPFIQLSDEELVEFNILVQKILTKRDDALSMYSEAEQRFEQEVGPLTADDNVASGFPVASSDLFKGRRRFDAFFYNPAARAIRTHFARQGRSCVSIADAGLSAWLPARFRRIPAPDGVEFLDSSDLFEINADIEKRIADGTFGDPARGRVQAGWLLLARSGQIYGVNGSVAIATKAHEGKVISDHVIRVAPNHAAAVRIGYIYIALSHPTLGRPLVKALAYGSSIPEIEVADFQQLPLVRLARESEDAIADLAEAASRMLSEADMLEQDIGLRADQIIGRFVRDHTFQR